MLHEGNRFGVSVLAQGQTGLSDFFARRGPEGIEPEFFMMRETPLVEGALAHFVARVVRSYWGGDHSLFLGHVEYARYGKGEPLLFHGGRYERMVGEPELFSRLPRGLLDQLLSRGHEKRFVTGDVLMEQGEVSDTLMLLVSGSVLVERPGPDADARARRPDRRDRGADPGPGRMATITAETDTTCIVVTRAELLEGLAEDPQAAVALLEILAGRFRETALTSRRGEAATRLAARSVRSGSCRSHGVR